MGLSGRPNCSASQSVGCGAGGSDVAEAEGAQGKSIATTFMRDIQGSAASKLAMFQRIRAAGGFQNEDPVELNVAEDLLRTFAAAEKKD